jgi:hypothetical protein
MVLNRDFEDAQLLLKGFLHYPVVIRTSIGEVSGVLVDAEVSRYGEFGSLLLYSHQGDWILIRSWIALKTARSST